MDLDFIEKKETIYKIVYSKKFDESVYKKNFILDFDIDKSLLKFVKKLENSKDLNVSEFFNDSFNLFKLIKLELNEAKNLYIYNYLLNEITPEIEKVYQIDKYLLYLKNTYYSALIPMTNNEMKNIKKEQIINFNNNNYEFIVLVNLGTNFELIIDNISYVIETNKSIVFSNKNSFDFKNIDKQEILILNYSILDGYKRFDYNKHPNQNI